MLRFDYVVYDDDWRESILGEAKWMIHVFEYCATRNLTPCEADIASHGVCSFY